MNTTNYIQHRWNSMERDLEKQRKELNDFINEFRSHKADMRKLDSQLRDYLEHQIAELTSIPQEWELDPKHECHIYFIRSLDSVKIGYSKNPSIRLSALQTANPNKLEMIYSFPSFQQTEDKIHNDLRKHHVYLEWFKYNDEVKQYIEDIRNGKKEL